ncbi:unnamed protein product [Arabidopsis lyrata]|uniref:Predicted protein n=1 Tax=Arabidopsis lyrata subsp. lyrata TaxID=81972 RepID=D7MW26_ARALL|nr:predicted protein [Arabidopsis lyrata subsp. lyrata]CAH8264201.1 unnamed protein product [Arabidopsis lyrata]
METLDETLISNQTTLRWRDGNGSWITISFGSRRSGSPEISLRRESAVLLRLLFF